MALVVAVHGIAQQLKGEDVIHAEWLPALRSGLRRVEVDFPNENDLRCVFYGDLFRPAGMRGDPHYNASDVDEWERNLLELWWREAARVDSRVVDPEADVRGRTPAFVQDALRALSNSRFFVGVAEKAMIGDLKQVHSYLQDIIIKDPNGTISTIKTEVQQRIAREVTGDTKIMIGHSLGSVVAYEALCAHSHSDWPITTLITLGSPLGIRNLIFDRLDPPPENNLGRWPGNIQRWTNIADGGDIVALEKELKPYFGNQVEDILIYNGATAHDIGPYLTARETGNAIAAGLGS